MFCCGCLNTEAKLRILDQNVTHDVREFLGLKDHDRYLYECICWTCYLVLMKSIKFRKQCLEARNLYLSMVRVSRDSLNTLYMLNFQPNLSQSKVVLINVGQAIETNEDSFFPIIQEIKSEVPDEGTYTDVNETSHDVKRILTEDNVLSNDYVVKNCKEFIEDDEIAPETLHFMTDKELKEEIVIKQEFSDTSLEESVDIATLKSGTPSDDERPLKKMLEKQDRINLEGIDTGTPARKRTINEIPQKTKLTKRHESIIGRNPIAVCKRCSQNLTAGSNVNKQIIKSTADSYDINNISPKINIVPKDKVQAINIIVQDHKTLNAKGCYSNAESDNFKQCLLNRFDVIAPSTSLVRNDERNKINICNKKESEKEFTCHIYQNKCITGNNLNIKIYKNTGEKLYKCDLCDYRCLQKPHLAEHIKYKHTKEKNFSCHMCQYKCVTKGGLNKHLRKHTGEKPYTCDLCDTRFSLQNQLKRHIMYKHIKEKNFSCHICQYKCVRKEDLNRHLRIHTGEKPYKCKLCDSKFSQHSQLSSHIMYKHTKEKNFSCHICQYKFVAKHSLNVHLRKHTGEKPYTCDLCDNRFSQQCLLKRHIMHKHTKEMNFSCHMCQYKCVTKRELIVHVRKHTGEKPYTCDLCDNRFSQYKQLRGHIMHKHTQEKNYSCHMCQYKCVTKSDLNRHLRKHTGERPYTCDLCDNSFSQKGQLRQHIMRKHTKEKNYSCHMCQYKCVSKVDLNRHLRKHTGEKPYKCEICDFKCSHRFNLKSHLKSKHTEEAIKKSVHI